MTIDKFRKQPVVIEATRLLGEESATEIIEWAGEENIKWVPEALPRLHSVACRCDGKGIVPGPSLKSLKCPETERTGGSPGYLRISTLEGEMRAEVGDWIIRGVQGEFYPCKNEIFWATYEPAHVCT